MQHNVLYPEGNLLSESYYDAHLLIEPFFIKPEVFHACEKDCALYRRELKEGEVCPQCKGPSYMNGRLLLESLHTCHLGQEFYECLHMKTFL